MFLECVEDSTCRYFNLFQEPILVVESKCDGSLISYRKIAGNMGRAGLYTRVFIYKRKLLFIPWNATVFFVYDLDREEETIIEIPNKKLLNQNYGLFRTAVQNNECVYAFGVGYSGIVKIDLDSLTAECLFDLREEKVTDAGVIREAAFSDDKVFAPVHNSKRLLVFDIKKESFEIIDIDVLENAAICAIGNINNQIWLAFDNGSVFFGDINTRQFHKNEKMSDVLNKGRHIRHMVCFHSQLFIFPSSGNKVFCYSIDDDYVKCIETPINSDGECFYYARADESELCFFSEIDNTLYSYSEQNNRFEPSEKQLSEKDYMNLMIRNISVISENKNITLKAFISGITEFI